MPGATEVVRAARNDDGDFIGVRKGEAHQVAAALAGRIRVARTQRRFFVEVGAVARAVDFVGRYLDVALYVERAREVEQVVRPLDVGFDEARRFFDRSVEVNRCAMINATVTSPPPSIASVAPREIVPTVTAPHAAITSNHPARTTPG